MSKRIIPGMVVAMLLVAIGVSAAEQHDHGSPGMRGFGDPDKMIEAMTQHLQLDETQAQSIRNIVSAAKPEMDELRSRAAANREAIAALDTNDADYNAKLQNLSEENGYLASQATQLHGRLRAEINAELTPEQQLELADRSNRMQRRFGERRHHRDRDSKPQ